MGDWLVQEVLEYFARVVLEPLPHLLLLMRDLVLRVPVVTDQWPVIRLMGRSVTVVEISYVLLVTVAGVIAMTHGGLQSEYSAKALLQRALLGFVAAHYVGPIVEQSTRGANALIEVLAPGGKQSLKQLDSGEAMAQQIARAPESILLLLVMQAVIVVLIVVLLVGWVSRLLKLVMLAGLGPLALACHGLPWLEQVALVWWRSLFAVLVTVVAQAALLQFGMELLLAPAANLSWAGTFDHSDVLTNLLLILCLLLAVIRMPSAIGQFLPAAGGQRGGGAFGMIMRYTLLHRVVRSGAKTNGPGAVIMTKIGHRFRRRQVMAGMPSDGPTWSGMRDRARGAVAPLRASAGSWSTSTAATGVGRGRWTPGQQTLVQARRQWSGRRAVLAGRSVGDPNQQAPRIAGQGRAAQQAGAAALVQKRKAAQVRPGHPAGSRSATGPLPGHTAGNPTLRNTPSPSAGAATNGGRVPGGRGAGASRARGWGSASPRSAAARRALPPGASSQASKPVTRQPRVGPGFARPTPNVPSRGQRAVNGGATGQAAAPWRSGQQPRLRPSTARANPPMRRRPTPPSRRRPEND